MRFSSKKLLIISAVTLGSIAGLSDLYAGGLEKSVMWSGRNAGVANAVVSSVAGAEALYFNPAGLATSEGVSVSGNISPTWIKFSAPVLGANTTLDSDTTMIPPGAALVSYKVTPELGVGFGYYVSGGAKAVYSSVPLTTAFAADLKSDISLTELSVGAGYDLSQFLDGLRVGLGYRIVFVKANVGLIQPNSATTFAAVALTDLSNTRFNGFKLGLQYAPKAAHWGLGVDWRTEVSFTADGTLAIRDSSAPTVTTTSPVSASAVFPHQVALGGYYDVLPNEIRLFVEYDFTQYNSNKLLALSSGGGLPLNWKNKNDIRLAGEYTAIPTWAFRAGYVYSTAVTPLGDASPIFSPPAAGHTVTLGAGKEIMEGLRADLALEYSGASGTVAAADNPAASTNLGNYSAKAYAIHAGMTYHIL